MLCYTPTPWLLIRTFLRILPCKDMWVIPSSTSLIRTWDGKSPQLRTLTPLGASSESIYLMGIFRSPNFRRKSLRAWRSRIWECKPKAGFPWGKETVAASWWKYDRSGPMQCSHGEIFIHIYYGNIRAISGQLTRTHNGASKAAT